MKVIEKLWCEVDEKIYARRGCRSEKKVSVVTTISNPRMVRKVRFSGRTKSMAWSDSGRRRNFLLIAAQRGWHSSDGLADARKKEVFGCVLTTLIMVISDETERERERDRE